MNCPLHLVVIRGDGVRGTILRKRPDTSKLSDVWTEGKPEVMQGDVVLVLRINAVGEHGFSYIRMPTAGGFVEGFVKSCYLTLRPRDVSVVAIAAVHRGDGETSTLLRKRADPTRDRSVYVDGRHCVGNGDVVHVLRLNAEDLLHVRPLPSVMIANASVHRLDGEPKTMLRQRPVSSRESDVWVKGHHSVAEGEHLDVLRMNAPNEEGFCWVKNVSGICGFIRSDYVCIQHSGELVSEPRDDSSKATAIKAFHKAIRSTIGLSKQKTLLRDLWSFHIRSFFHDRSQNVSPSDFSVALFALGEDSLMDVLSEAFVLAVSSDAAVSSSIIADMLAFLPKDTFFMSLVKFVIASEERVYLPLISATRHVISALSLHDGDFAASVVQIASRSIASRSLLASCELTDEYSRMIGLAVVCLILDETSASVGNGNSQIISKLFNIFGSVSSPEGHAVPSGCGPDCEDDHDDDGDCLICGCGWGPHSGHRCQTGARGSWIVGGIAASRLPVDDVSSVLTTLRMQGELLLGRICAQIVSAEPATQTLPTSNMYLQPDICRIARILACALCPFGSDIKHKVYVDSLSCALLNYLDAVHSQSDSVRALSNLAANLGAEHPVAQHCQIMISVLTMYPSIWSSAAVHLRPRPIPANFDDIVSKGISQQNASFAFAMEQETIRLHDPFLSLIFAQASKRRATSLFVPLAQAHEPMLSVEADTRDFFVKAAPDPLLSDYMHAVDAVLDISSFPLTSVSTSSSFVWIDPKSSGSISGSPGNQMVTMNTRSGDNSIVHSSVVLDGSWQWTIEFTNHKGQHTWVGICSKAHLDKAILGDRYNLSDGLGSDAFSFGIHHKKGVKHGGRLLKTGIRWKTGQSLKLVYEHSQGQLSFYRNDELLYTADDVPTEGMYAAVSSPMGSMKFKTLSCSPSPSRNVPHEDMARFSASLGRVFSPINSCSLSQFISILRLISAADNRTSLAHLKTTVKSILVPTASRCLLAFSAMQLESMFGMFSHLDTHLVANIAEILAMQPLQDVMKRLIPLMKSVSINLFRGKSDISSLGHNHMSFIYEHVSRGLFSGTLAAFNSITTLLGRDGFQALKQASQPSQIAHCEILLIPRWAIEDMDPVRAYAQILTFGDHRVCAVLGLGWADIRVHGQLRRISAVEAQILWMLTCQPGLSNGELSQICHVSGAALDAALFELNAIGALAELRSSEISDDVPTVMGSSQLPQTSIHIGAACINAVFWLCRRIKEASGVVDELQTCDACCVSTGSSPAVVASVIIDLIRRGIIYRHRGYLIAPAAGGDEARISALSTSVAEAHSSTVPWQLVAPFERLVLVRMDETSPACHTHVSSSSSSACVHEQAFRDDLMVSLFELVKQSSSGDVLAVSDLFQVCGSVISYAAVTVFEGRDAVVPVPDLGDLSLDGECPLCLEEKPLVRAPCGHARCRDCFNEYFSTAVRDSSTPARALGNQGLNITKLTCGTPNCEATIPLSFIQKISPQSSSHVANILTSVVVNNLVSGQCAFARCVCSTILVAPSQECEALCVNCGRAASIGNFKRQNFSESWNHHVDLSSHESMNWKLLNSSGNPDRIGMLRYKPCPGCGVMSTRCGCDPSKIVCDKLERCPQERCDHMSCAACGLNWCWVCSAKNSTESRCSRPKSERADRKERFLHTSNSIEKLKSEVPNSYFLSAPSLRQRVASRLIRQFFDGEHHHSPLSLDQMQKILPRERRLIMLPRMISLLPALYNSEFISWTTVNCALVAIQTIPLPALFQALEIQSDADAIVAIGTLLGISPPSEPASRFPLLKKGDRVRRGPDWKWGDQDMKGDGVVVDGSADRTDGWVRVEWCSGGTNSYRYSSSAGGFDVERADFADAVESRFSESHLPHVGSWWACGGNILGTSACSGSGNCSALCRSCGAGTHWTCCGSSDESSRTCFGPMTASQAKENDRLFRTIVRKVAVPCRKIQGLSGGHFSVGGGGGGPSGGSAARDPSATSSSSLLEWASGSAIVLSRDHAKYADAARGPLRAGDVGNVVTSNAEGLVVVRTAAGRQWWYHKAAISVYQPEAASCGIDRALTSSFDSGFSFIPCSPTETDVCFPSGPVNLFADVLVGASECTSARFCFIPLSGNNAWAVGVIPESQQSDKCVIWQSPTGWNLSGVGSRTVSARAAFARAESQKLICTVFVDSTTHELTLDVAGDVVGKVTLQPSLFPLRLGMCGHNGTRVRVVSGASALPQNKFCPTGHQLKPYAYPSDHHKCDLCDSEIESGQSGLRCPPCDYDLCPKCARS